MESIVYFLVVLLFAMVHKGLAYYHTKAANSATGCVACGSDFLHSHTPDRVVCGDCGYEGARDGGGAVNHEDVYAFSDNALGHRQPTTTNHSR